MAPSFLLALFFGLVSFFSPCILPLVPVYLAVLSGEAEGVGRGRVFVRALFFVLGFSSVFVLLGLSASALGGLLLGYRPVLEKAGGLIVVLLGLHQTGLLRLLPLYRARRLAEPKRDGSIPAALLIGMVFALGWTPCVGPVLASILTLAGSSETVARGAALLAAYSLGLAVPFLAAALGIGAVQRRFQAMKKYARHFEVAGGIVLICLGVMMCAGIRWW